MKILVIGKNGYISGCFQKYMQKFPEASVDAISARNDEWKAYDFRGYDAVFNTIGLAHNDARKGTEEEFISCNVNLPRSLAEKAKDSCVPLFIHMSSMIVYGNMSGVGERKLINENTIPKPDNIYGRSKLMGEDAIKHLRSDSFHVAIIRSPLVYGETAVDNFLALKNLAKKLPIFPYLENERSMIYYENLCELIRLIVTNESEGLFYPQQEVYISTSQIIKDIAKASNHRIWMPEFFYPVIKLLSNRIGLINKVFGSLAYDMTVSNHFQGSYRVVGYQESIHRIVSNMNT